MTEWCDPHELPDSDYQKTLCLERYRWAARRITGHRVANAACGSNFGTPMLDAGHREVTGFDQGLAQSIKAREKGYGVITIANIEELSFEGFDTLVCIETLEHLKEPWTFLENLRVSELVLTTPIVPTKHENPHHLHDFTEQQILHGLRRLGWVVTHLGYQHDPWWKHGAMNILVRAEKAPKEIHFATSIAHAPHKPERIATLARMLDVLGDNVHVESLPGKPHEWSLRQWEGALGRGTHALLMNDDLVLRPDFRDALWKAIAVHPAEIVSLYAAHKQASGVWHLTAEGLIGNAYVIPMPLLERFLEWRAHDLVPGVVERLSEDQLVNLFAMAMRMDIHHVPLVDHDNSIPSCYGNEGSGLRTSTLPLLPATTDFNVSPSAHLGRLFRGNHWALQEVIRQDVRLEMCLVERSFQVARGP